VSGESDDEVDLNDFLVDLTGVTRPSRTMAWVREDRRPRLTPVETV
jgi:hypothetical protein